eukprot:3042007-Prymnesium_polylepis.1
MDGASVRLPRRATFVMSVFVAPFVTNTSLKATVFMASAQLYTVYVRPSKDEPNSRSRII